MSFWSAPFLSQWLDDVAAGLSLLLSRFGRDRSVELDEQADGGLVAAIGAGAARTPLDEPPLRLDGSRFDRPLSRRLDGLFRRGRVSVRLDPARFVFRTLDLPGAASGFLEGVVRAQIDRLAPWKAADALFGWSAPVSVGQDRIRIIVAVTAREEAAPLEDALAERRVRSIEMFTSADGDPSTVISMAPAQIRVANEATRLRLAAAAGLGACALVFVLSALAWAILGASWDARLAETQRAIADRRAQLMKPSASGAELALDGLKKRKRAAPSPVMILEALSKTLPDDTHLTELVIDNQKVQISGQSGDASRLIRLIEQSRQFAHAAFFAPTVRGPNGGEIFHIEAHLEPSFEAVN